MLHRRPLPPILAIVCMTACSSNAPRAPEVAIPPPSATPAASATASPPPIIRASADCGSHADADGLIDAATVRAGWMATAPALAAETRCCAALEMARSPSVLHAWQALDAKKATGGEAADTELRAIEDEGGACSLALLVWHADIDIDIHAADALGRVHEAIGPAAFPFLLDSAGALAVFVPGSEEATLHGMLQQTFAKSMNALTGANVALRSGQDPDGLKAAIPVWRDAAARASTEAMVDMKGKRDVPTSDRTCSKDDECDAVRADCSNVRCVGVRSDHKSGYAAPLDCNGYSGKLANYDCQPQFHIESPRCEAGLCTSRRLPK